MLTMVTAEPAGIFPTMEEEVLADLRIFKVSLELTFATAMDAYSPEEEPVLEDEESSEDDSLYRSAVPN